MTINIKKTLEIGKVRELLNENETLLFVVTDEKLTRSYVLELQKELPNYVVTRIEWLNKLNIVPSISTKVVLENILEFHNCIELFDKTAHSLMNEMAETFDINLNNSNEIYELKTKRSENQRGEINNEWKYHFHGKGCSFTNTNTEQFLDVQINNGIEFGELDTYYLMKFIQTTESLKKASQILNNKTENMRKVIETLWSSDYLIELPDGINNELILNRNKKPIANTVYN
ncbi:DUF6896 domain-containing protein [Winogradskyella helgolandensis]|uniref:DUF6896 domain-containing protein n=1 Tax=Winogradskyella helgolandensis TaxID=2697010 RepID=UPI0015CA3043|nr:hypothetical protein [Winogradskyella helgolandensis]